MYLFFFTTQHNSSGSTAHNSVGCLQVHDKKIYVFINIPAKEQVLARMAAFPYSGFSVRLVEEFCKHDPQVLDGMFAKLTPTKCLYMYMCVLRVCIQTYVYIHMFF